MVRLGSVPWSLWGLVSIILWSVVNADSQGKDAGCPFYGCPVLPRDIAFDEAANELLTHLETETEPADHNELWDAWKEQQQGATLTLIGFKGGSPDQQINQDRSFLIHPFQIVSPNNEIDETFHQAKLLGVFDGHGWEGEVVSQIALTDVPQIISHNLFAALQKHRQQKPQQDGDNPASSMLDDDSLDEIVKKVLVDAFVEVDQVNIPRDQSGGCTASVVLQLDGRVYVANAGDSQSILVTYRPSDGSIHVPFVTREDKPHLEDESERIRERGGIVTLPDDEDDTSRVWDPEEQMGLAMSRSLGDHTHTPLGVIPHPLVDAFHLSEIKAQHSQAHPKKQAENISQNNCKNDDEDDKIGGECNVDEHDEVQVFAISATDGLMDYWDPLELATAIGKSTIVDSSDTYSQGSQQKKQHLLLACKDVIFTAAQGWLEEMEGQYRDDIAIVACRLSP